MPRKKSPRRSAGIDGIPTAIPGTEQHTDEVLEREYLHRKAALGDAKDAAERKAQAEANLQRRFEELADADPEDPRAKAYTTASGDVISPKQKPVLKVKRAPSRADAALATAGATEVPDEVPDLPYPEGDGDA